MAQYRLSVSIISRKEGRSATAMAAYRAGILMEDRRTGERFDFTRRSGVLHSEMVLPANAPVWASDRAEFWNRSELAETRQKAQVAREIQLSLPHELTGQQRQALTLTFAEHVTERYGLAVDVNIHAPGKHGDERNHHAHLLLCTRPFDADSKTGFGNKNRELDMIACKRSGKATEVEQLRAVWEEYSNQALEQANIRTSAGDLVQVDRRSYERQGSEQEATVKLGPAAAGLQRRGEDSERAAINAEVLARNEVRAQNSAALDQDLRSLAALHQEIQNETEVQSPKVYEVKNSLADVPSTPNLEQPQLLRRRAASISRDALNFTGEAGQTKPALTPTERTLAAWERVQKPYVPKPIAALVATSEILFQ